MRKLKPIRVIYLFKKSGKASDSINLYINLNHTINHRVLLQYQNLCTSYLLLYGDRNMCTANFFKDIKMLHAFNANNLEKNKVHITIKL